MRVNNRIYPYMTKSGIEVLGVEIKQKTPNDRRRSYVKCRCFCGKLFECAEYSVVSGNTSSCGCVRNIKCKENLQNKWKQIKEVQAVNLNAKGKVPVGAVQVIATYMHPDKQGRNRTFAKCRCYCGNEFECLESSLKYGNTRSCGCLKKKTAQTMWQTFWNDYNNADKSDNKVKKAGTKV